MRKAGKLIIRFIALFLAFLFVFLIIVNVL